MSTLLEKALAAKVQVARKKVSPEDIELALAWLSGKIGTGQAVAAYGMEKTGHSKAVYRIATSLRAAFDDMKITLRD